MLIKCISIPHRFPAGLPVGFPFCDTPILRPRRAPSEPRKKALRLSMLMWIRRTWRLPETSTWDSPCWVAKNSPWKNWTPAVLKWTDFTAWERKDLRLWAVSSHQIWVWKRQGCHWGETNNHQKVHDSKICVEVKTSDITNLNLMGNVIKNWLLSKECGIFAHISGMYGEDCSKHTGHDDPADKHWVTINNFGGV